MFLMLIEEKQEKQIRFKEFKGKKCQKMLD